MLVKRYKRWRPFAVVTQTSEKTRTNICQSSWALLNSRRRRKNSQSPRDSHSFLCVDLAWRREQQMSLLSSWLLPLHLPSCLFPLRVWPWASLQFTPWSSWQTDKHWRRFPEGREDTDQRGRTARMLNNGLQDRSATPTRRTEHSNTDGFRAQTSNKSEKKSVRVEGWSQIAAARPSGRQRHLHHQNFATGTTPVGRTHSAQTGMSLSLLWFQVSFES